MKKENLVIDDLFESDYSFNVSIEPTPINFIPEHLNCLTLVYEVYQEFLKYSLPPLWSREQFAESEITEKVDLEKSPEVKLGDIFFFKRAHHNGSNNHTNDNDYYHVAIATGRKYKNGNPELLHASWVDGGVSRWPYEKFFMPLVAVNSEDSCARIRYTELVGVKRLKPELWNEHIRPLIDQGLFLHSSLDTNPFTPDELSLNGTSVVLFPTTKSIPGIIATKGTSF